MYLSKPICLTLTALFFMFLCSADALEILNPAKPVPEITLVAQNLRKQSGEIAKAPDGAPAIKLAWSNTDANKLEVFFEPGIDIPEFKRAKFEIEVFLQKESFATNFNIRLIDNQVEIFQFRKFLKVDELKAGWQTFVFEIDTAAFENDPNVSSWGRNANQKIDYPAKFFGFCIDFTRVKGGGVIYIGKVNVKVLK